MNEETNRVTAKDNILEILHLNFLLTIIIGVFGLCVSLVQEKFGFFSYGESSLLSSYQYSIESTLSSVFGANIVEVVVFTAIFSGLAYYLAKGYTQNSNKANNPLKKIISIVMIWAAGLVVFATIMDLLNKLVNWDFKTQDIIMSAITLILFAAVFSYEYFRYKTAITENTVKNTTFFVAGLATMAILSVVASLLVFGTPARFQKMEADKSTYSNIALGESDVYTFVEDSLSGGQPLLPTDTQQIGKFIFADYVVGNEETDLGYTYKLTQQFASLPAAAGAKKSYSDGKYAICVNFKESYTKKNDKDTYDSHPAGEYCKDFTITQDDINKLPGGSSSSNYDDSYESGYGDSEDSSFYNSFMQ